MSLRHSIPVRVARGIQKIPLSWMRPFESLLLTRTQPSYDENIIFLLGLPRSGSTLSYQCLIHSIQPIYLSNLWNLLYDLPLIGGIFSKTICSEHSSNFTSDEGFVNGLCGPAEGLRFWSYWGGYVLDETEKAQISEQLEFKRISYLRKVLHTLTSPSKPMISGYAGHLLWLKNLRENFPNAVFIMLHRDPLSNAVSLLKIRKKRQGDWFSLFPKECDTSLNIGIHEEVASQVYWLNQRLSILEDDEKTIYLNYESLCQDPNGALQAVIESCNTQGLKLSMQKSLPSTFEYRLASPEADDDTAKLARELERLEAEHGPLPERSIMQ